MTHVQTKIKPKLNAFSYMHTHFHDEANVFTIANIEIENPDDLQANICGIPCIVFNRWRLTFSHITAIYVATNNSNPNRMYFVRSFNALIHICKHKHTYPKNSVYFLFQRFTSQSSEDQLDCLMPLFLLCSLCIVSSKNACHGMCRA